MLIRQVFNQTLPTMRKISFYRLSVAVITLLLSQVILTAQDITVTKGSGNWIIRGAKHSVTFSEKDFGMTVTAGPMSWIFIPSDTNDITVNSGGRNFNLKLTDATVRDFSEYKNGFKKGLKITLSSFKSRGQNFDFNLQLFLCLENDEEDLVCDVVPEENSTLVKLCTWPKGLRSDLSDFTVMPTMQGMLLPRDWQYKVQLYSNGLSHSRAMYMPWWGHLKGKSALLVILETPDDGGCIFSHPAGGPTAINVKWLHTLGSLKYKRSVRYCFIPDGNLVTLTKRYRRYVVEKGHFVSLKEKIARNPLVGKLVGSPVITAGILTHIEPASRYYNKVDTSRNNRLNTFKERADQISKLPEKGITKAYFHLDGWGYRGYDNLHPDNIPPSPAAGGWEGLKNLADVCDKLGYVFALHDQFRDYFLDAASYDPRHTIITEKGNRPLSSQWYGGSQSVLCSQLAPGYVARNYRSLLDHGVKVHGSYLDVFAVVPPDECYNPEHPVTRTECLRYRSEGFNFIRSFGGVISSEESLDWAIPYLDLVHWGPFALDPSPEKGKAMGIPVPLFSLVYHDALLIPWTASIRKGSWGIPDNDYSYLYALLNAGMPYLSITPGDEEIARVKIVCDLHKRVALLEMTNFEFTEASYRKQRTTFADGTTVTVDLDKGTYSVKPGGINGEEIVGAILEGS